MGGVGGGGSSFGPNVKKPWAKQIPWIRYCFRLFVSILAIGFDLGQKRIINMGKAIEILITVLLAYVLGSLGKYYVDLKESVIFTKLM